MKKKLEIGYKYTDLMVRHEKLDLPQLGDLVIIFVADLHLIRFNLHVVETLIETIKEQQPDLLLLGGDYVDSKSGLRGLRRLFAAFKDVITVGIMGNHDQFWGTGRIRALGEETAVTWLDNHAFTTTIKGVQLAVYPKGVAYQPSGGVSILLLHEPLPPQAQMNDFHLVLAGHLHGGQVVLWEKGGRLLPAAFFYSCNFLRRRIQQTYYLVTRGIGDTLPLRYNCPREVIKITQ